MSGPLGEGLGSRAVAPTYEHLGDLTEEAHTVPVLELLAVGLEEIVREEAAKAEEAQSRQFVGSTQVGRALQLSIHSVDIGS